MAKVIFTPWKDASELLAVRSFFYPAESYDGTDMRSTACAIVAAWKLRGNLPHAVEATALLTDAILHDDAEKNSIFAIRATYSAAFCRFVTALVDSKQPGQRKTMFQRAVDLGLPASFVELRHEATHREPPSLVVLRNATQRSLEWLWGYYWAKADPDAAFLPPPPADADDEDALLVLREAVRDCVRLFLEEGEQQNQQEQQQQQLPARKKRRVQTLMGTSLATRLGSVCREKEGRRAVCGGLVEEGALVPGGRTLDDSMDNTFSRWDPCLQTLTDNCPAFLTSLAEEMVDMLAFTAAKANSKEKDDAYREGIFLWLDHILRSTEWASRRRVLSLVYVRAACEASSGHWMRLLKGVVEEASSSGESLRTAEAVLEADSMQVDGDVDGSARELGKYGWEMDGAWDSRPLGGNHHLVSLSLTPPTKPQSMNIFTALRPTAGLRPCLSPTRFSVSRTPTRLQARTMHVHSIPMWTGKGNNYAYLVTDEPTKQSVIIDPANPPEVAPVLKSQLEAGKIDLTAIVNTHHHWDHAGGNEEMLKIFGKLPVIGGRDCQSATKKPAHGEVFKIGDRISVTALHTPCHTQDSVCYFMQDGDQRVVFTGDTLFIGGCGRFFEGTAAEMHKALNETLASLPDDTKVYPGHEYTKANVKFCATVSQSEPIKKLQAFADQNQQTQGKFTIGDEKLHNVFMRVEDPEIQQKTGKKNPVEVMAALREMKNAM
ncbi:Metallo-hydrolase/oxidoreductase [Aspergillus campestris IBT 28561]|uniref:hydroxyacylglutathione hydrolase n=1 Tax=Aspergillus campestris (strain IBT 28561) TaxID=1392248 RepID=A0A2I1D0Z1_ASPC2|nr:Metallo-hydrolase/oxidoreductase [Aspergillus campestris IBT 28561]PKY03541.1 Metallo-hydrolase/oxidoreductase [Aspergillus campestris IBT 28561]